MKRILLIISVLTIFANTSFAQNKSHYPILNVNNTKKILYKNVYYDVDTAIVSIKTDNIKKIPFKIRFRTTLEVFF